MYTTKERRGHKNRLFNEKHLLFTARLVATGMLLVTPIRLFDAPPVSDPGGDPIAAINKVIIDGTPVPIYSAIAFDGTEEPILYDDEEPVLPEDEESVPSDIVGESLDVPTDKKANNGSKSYMDYRTIADSTSMQYEMQQDAWTDDQGLRRDGDYYMVALGTFYAKNCGETFRITLDSGESFDVITGDIMDDNHTDEKHQHRNGVIVEFIVDTKSISKTCRVMGDISHAGFSGRIKTIERLNQGI